jgi:hypothetical protein
MRQEYLLTYTLRIENSDYDVVVWGCEDSLVWLETTPLSKYH